MKNMKNFRRVVVTLVVVVLISGVSFGFPIQPNPENEFEFMDFLMNIVQENYKDNVDRETLIEGAYKGIFEQLDEHSVYFNAEEYKEFNEDTSGEFGGIGISVTKEEQYIKVVSPIKGTPGDRAGLRAGDIILSANGTDLTDMDLHEAVKILKGNPGSKVLLEIRRNGQVLEKEIVREIIKVEPVEYEVKNDDVGYIRITQFTDDTKEGVQDALKDVNNKNIKKVIVDLRNNPGGLLSEVVDVADLFLPKDKEIVFVDYKANEDVSYKSETSKYYDGDLIVLVNGGSASASEIFAGAMKANNVGDLIGTKTYGKGTVQTLLRLVNGGGVKLTVAEYMTADRQKIDGQGIKPHITVENEDLEQFEENVDDFVPMNEQKTYSQYSVGLNVYGAQQRLSVLGYDLSIDGIFGPQTESVITQFQQKNNLPVTKRLDYATRTKLAEKTDNLIDNGPKDLQLQKALELLK